MKKSVAHIHVIAILLFLLPLLSHAQPSMGSDDVDDVPVDGGLSLLVAAGIGLSAKKGRQYLRNTSEQ